MTEGEDNLFGEKETTSTTYGKWQLQVEPQLKYPLLNGKKTITIDQNNKGFGELGSHIWDAGLVLARFLENDGQGRDVYTRNPDFVPFCSGKNCIELGSGTGLTGIVAAQMGAGVTMTDKQGLLKLIQHNVDKNIPELKDKVTIAELVWGTGQLPSTAPFDIILAADLTYDMDDLPILVKQLLDLSTDDSVVFLAYGKERAAMVPFFAQAEQVFSLEHVPDEQLIRDDNDDPLSTIAIVKLRKKRTM